MEGKVALNMKSYTGGRSVDKSHKTDKTAVSIFAFPREAMLFSSRSDDTELRSRCWTNCYLGCFAAYIVVSLSTVRTLGIPFTRTSPYVAL